MPESEGVISGNLSDRSCRSRQHFRCGVLFARIVPLAKIEARIWCALRFYELQLFHLYRIKIEQASVSESCDSDSLNLLDQNDCSPASTCGRKREIRAASDKQTRCIQPSQNSFPTNGVTAPACYAGLDYSKPSAFRLGLSTRVVAWRADQNSTWDSPYPLICRRSCYNDEAREAR
jgi:hypothetical protein